MDEVYTVTKHINIPEEGIDSVDIIIGCNNAVDAYLELLIAVEDVLTRRKELRCIDDGKTYKKYTDINKEILVEVFITELLMVK